jgi:hypothetical protein
VFKQEEIVTDYVKKYLDEREKAQSKPQKRWNTLFALILALMFGLFLFEGYVVYKGYSVLLEMQEAHKKALKDWYAIPDYKSDKVGNERETKK